MTSQLAARVNRVLKVTTEESKATEESESSHAEYLLMSMEELSSQVITLGKSHRGRTYLDLWEHESKYCEWFLSTYEKSTKIEHRRFIRFLEMKIKRAELELSLPDSTQKTSEDQGPIHPRAKVQAKSKMLAKSRPSIQPQDVIDLQEEEDPWTNLEDMESTVPEAVYSDVASLQSRMLTMESNLQEVINHLRGS